MSQEIELVHLVWKPAGIEVFRNFVRAYREHPAGIDHKLVVLYNGFRGDDMDDHRELLINTPHRELRLPERASDIQAYMRGAQLTESRYLCFVNSFSTPLASGWLRALYEHVAQPRVGAVGATGSWESHYTNYLRSLDAIGPPSSLTQRAKTLVWRLKLRRRRAHFYPAPNPHLRTTGFMIERSRWLSLQTSPLRSKWHTHLFESGMEGMTPRLKYAGLEVLVVGRNGVAYPNEKWPESGTFRSGNQDNLLVADNRTREYDEAGDEARRHLRLLAWGHEGHGKIKAVKVHTSLRNEGSRT
jgi:hypothetical protein